MVRGKIAGPYACGPGNTDITFKTDKAGSYTWRCWARCGGDPKGMGGAVATKGWMQGNVIVT